jgi:pimeloyl-ACP methyl ester carboxylesterase
MSYVKTANGKIHYKIRGEGSTVVLIRGLGCWSEHWFGWDELLAKNCRVITYDKKGLGLSTTQMSPWHSVSELAEEVSIILKQERIESAHIVGTSLGGMVAMTFAIDFPEMTQSLTVIASSIGRSGHMRMSWPAIKLLLLRSLNNETFFENLAKLLTSNATSDTVRKKLADDWREIEKKQKSAIFTVFGQLSAALRFNKWEELTKITAPTQVVVGNDDYFVPRGNSLFLHSHLPGSKLVEVENAGHEPHICQPEALAEIVTSFASQQRL